MPTSVNNTTGFHRVGNVSTLAPSGLDLQAVPGATIYVTETYAGTQATIYSDPSMTMQIVGAVLTADLDGNYDYYIPLNYCVTENISAPNGTLATIVNLAQNGPQVATLTTTANSTDTVLITGVTTSSHYSLQPTNSAAATMLTSTYVSTKSAGSVTITHPSTAGATFDIIATTY